MSMSRIKSTATLKSITCRFVSPSLLFPIKIIITLFPLSDRIFNIQLLTSVRIGQLIIIENYQGRSLPTIYQTSNLRRVNKTEAHLHMRCAHDIMQRHTLCIKYVIYHQK